MGKIDDKLNGKPDYEDKTHRVWKMDLKTMSKKEQDLQEMAPVIIKYIKHDVSVMNKHAEESARED